MQVPDSRRTARYIPEPPLTCRFGRDEVAICNFGRDGAQIEHDAPLAVSRGAFSLSPGPVGVPLEVAGEVIWSRLLPSVADPAKYRYRSGIRFDPAGRYEAERVFELLVGAGRARPDTESLERKRRALESRAAATQSQMFLRAVSPVSRVPPDTAKRIRDAHERLAADAAERARWDALGNASLIRDPERRDRYRDALAVWEYLDHEIDLEIVARVIRTLL
ncbi:MAG: hypothetical protein ACRD2J_08835 [Thermoanaerobaculia bacterium]